MGRIVVLYGKILKMINLEVVKKRRLSKISILILILFLFILSIIVFYINPYIVRIYENAEIEIPNKIYFLIKLNKLEIFFWGGGIFTCFLLLKDFFLKSSLIVYINITLILLILTSLLLYFERLEAFHWPVWGL